MAKSSTPRRVLQDLPVNAFGTPNASTLSTSATSNLKRQIHQVEDPTLLPVLSRSRLADDIISRPNSPCLASKERFAKSARAASYEHETETNEEETQGPSTSIASESINSDMEDATVDTQQTAAKEIHQAAQSLGFSRAEILRLRLRVALFKVRTNQTHIPVSQLHIPRLQAEDCSLSAWAPPKQTALQRPTLLPAPILRPTLCSDRLSQPTQMLSSPPSTRIDSPTKASDFDTFRTPSLPLSRCGSSHQLGSPPNSQEGGSKDIEAEDSPLSSNAVQGHAAISLLGLRDDKR